MIQITFYTNWYFCFVFLNIYYLMRYQYFMLIDITGIATFVLHAINNMYYKC